MALAGEFHSAVLTEHGRLFTWGSNQYSENGHSGPGDEKPKEVRIQQEDGTVAHILSISTGCNHIHALTSRGTVYAFGYNSYAQLGLGNKEKVNEPKLVPLSLEKNIKRIESGYFFTTFLTHDEQLYICGQNNYGQLGLGHKLEGTSLVRQEHFNDPKYLGSDGIRFRHIVCGGYFMVIVTGNNNLFCMGDNTYGQCGVPTAVQAHNPVMPNHVQGYLFRSISCGHSHVCAITSDFKVFAWGGNQLLQLGTGTRSSHEPAQVQLLPKPVSHIVCGRDTTYMFTMDRELYSMGCNNYRQAGVGSDATKFGEPKNVACFNGKHITLHSKYQHVLVIPCSNKPLWNELLWQRERLSRFNNVILTFNSVKTS